MITGLPSTDWIKVIIEEYRRRSWRDVHSTVVNKTTKRRRKRRVQRVKDVSEWGVPEWRALLQGKELTNDDDGVRRVTTDVVFSHEDDVYYTRRVIKGEKDIKKNHDYTILRQVFDMARDGGGDDWVEDRFYVLYSLKERSV